MCVFYEKGFHVELLCEIISFWGYKRLSNTKFVFQSRKPSVWIE